MCYNERFTESKDTVIYLRLKVLGSHAGVQTEVPV